MNSRTGLLAACLCALMLGGCGGGDTYVKVQGTTTISKGQELTDLQRARDEGAIGESDYNAVREKILRRSN